MILAVQLVSCHPKKGISDCSLDLCHAVRIRMDATYVPCIKVPACCTSSNPIVFLPSQNRGAYTADYQESSSSLKMEIFQPSPRISDIEQRVINLEFHLGITPLNSFFELHQIWPTESNPLD